MEIEAKIRYRGIVGMPYPEFRRTFLVPMWHAMGKYWHRLLRPKHFTHAGAREYHYTPRKGERGSGRPFHRSYTGRKLKEKGHTRPLEWSGELKRRSRYYRLANTRKGVRVILPQAQKANYRHPASNINMRVELTAISPQDSRELIRFGNRYLARRLSGFSREHVKTIR